MADTYDIPEPLRDFNPLVEIPLGVGFVAIAHGSVKATPVFWQGPVKAIGFIVAPKPGNPGDEVQLEEVKDSKMPAALTFKDDAAIDNFINLLQQLRQEPLPDA